MENNNMVHGFCPKCYEELSIPDTLQIFSCMYCGARIRPEEFLAEKPEIINADNSDETYYLYAYNNIGSCILGEEKIMDFFNKHTYEQSFAEYTARHSEVFSKLSAYLLTLPSDKATEMLTACARRFVDAAKQFIINGDNGKLSNKNSMIDKTKIIMVVYLFPSILGLKLAKSREIAEAIQSAWVKEFPKHPLQLGEFDEINSGFKKKFLGLCFITTAVCEFEGKPDNCEELTAFRSFRDNYLANVDGGKHQIEEYYEIAPMIVNMINYADNPSERYKEIKDKYLVPCYIDINNHRFEQCHNTYTDMVNYLKNKYYIS